MNLLYKPVDTESIKREIQSAQTVIELLLLMAAEKEAEKPARSGNFETTFTVDGKERKVERTPDGRFAATKKAVGDAAAAVGKAAGSAGKAVGDAAKGLLETDQEKFQKAWDKTSGIREAMQTPGKVNPNRSLLQDATREERGALQDLEKVIKRQSGQDLDYAKAQSEAESYAQLLSLNFGSGKISPEQYAKESKELLAKMADLAAKSFEDNPSKADQVKKAIKGLPGAISKSVSDTAKSLQENSSKAIADAEAAFVMADKTTKEAIGNAQKSSLDTLEKGKKGILDKAGATGKAASDAFSSVLKAASSAGDGVKQKVDAAKEKGKEIIDSIGKSAIEKGKEAFASIDLEAVEKVKNAVVTATGAIACALTVGVSVGAGAIIGVGTARSVLSVLPGMGSLGSTIIGVMSGLNVAEILMYDPLGVIPAMMKDVEQAFENIKSSIEKAKTEQEAKREEPKEVSAAALDYLGYILGY